MYRWSIELEGIFVLPLAPRRVRHSYLSKEATIDPLYLWFIIAQPPGFEDPKFPDHVYRLNKALHGLKQAPRAWYDTLKEFLMNKGFKPGSLDPALFTKSYDGELFVYQIYVDDITFGYTDQRYSDEFAYMMSEEYQMSMMGVKEICPRGNNKVIIYFIIS